MQVEDPDQLELNLSASPAPEGEVSEEVSEVGDVSEKNGWLAWVIGLAVLGGVGWLIFSRVILPRFMPQFPPGGPMPVAITNPNTTTVRDSSEYLATLTSRQAITVQPQVGGRITQILVQAGDRVTAGTPLIQLDAAEQQAQVSGNAAAIAAANADLAAAQADLDAARRALDALKANRAARQADLTFNREEFQRFQELETQGATSRQTLDEKQNALQQAQAGLSQIDADIRAQDAAIARAQANIIRSRKTRDQAIASANQSQVQLQYYSVTAPITGIVGDIPVKVGDVVETSTALLNLAQNQQVEIQLQIPQEKSDQLRTGLPVQLVSPTGQPLKTGSIFFIAPSVDPQTQAIQAKAVFDNGDGKLRTNQRVRARVIWATRPGVLVPTAAISRLAGQNFVFTAVPASQASCEAPPAGGPGGPPPGAPDPSQLVAQQKPVELGQIIGNNQEILKGLSRGDRVITSGLLQLQDCMPIQDGPPPGNF